MKKQSLLFTPKKRLKEETSLEMGNGGVVVKVGYDSIGRKCLKVTASHFGTKMNDMEIPINRLGMLKLIIDLADEYTQFSDGENEKAYDKDFGVGMETGGAMQSLNKFEQLLVEILQQFHGIPPKMRFAIMRNPLAQIDTTRYISQPNGIDPFESSIPVKDSTYSPPSENVEEEEMSKS